MPAERGYYRKKGRYVMFLSVFAHMSYIAEELRTQIGFPETISRWETSHGRSSSLSDPAACMGRSPVTTAEQLEDLFEAFSNMFNHFGCLAGPLVSLLIH